MVKGKLATGVGPASATAAKGVGPGCCAAAKICCSVAGTAWKGLPATALRPWMALNAARVLPGWTGPRRSCPSALATSGLRRASEVTGVVPETPAPTACAVSAAAVPPSCPFGMAMVAVPQPG